MDTTTQDGTSHDRLDPSDHTTMTEILAQFVDAGFDGSFEVADGGSAIRCLACEEESATTDIPLHTLRRLEGASDPADMAAVAAITCPRCRARGTMVLPFGPNATAAEALVLASFRDARHDSVAPRSSAPGETVGDHGEPDDRHADHQDDHQDAARDVMPGDVAPAFAAPSSTGRELSLDDFVGKVPVTLTFTGTMSKEATGALVASFDEVFAEFGRRRVQSLIVTPETREAVRRHRQTGTTVPLLADREGQLLATYASSATFPATVVIDEAGTVTGLVEGGVAGDHAAAVLSQWDRHEQTEARRR